MKDFEHRIKALQAEVEALKAVKQKSSTTLATYTKKVTCSALLMRGNSTPLGPGVIWTRNMALVEIVPKDSSNPLIFSFSQPSYSDRGNRSSKLYPWMVSNGNSAVLVDPGTSPSDNSMADGTTRTINMTIYITATGDFSVNVSQIQYSTREP